MNTRTKKPSPPTAEAVQTCACMSLRKASRAVTQFYDSIMQESGLRVTQITLIRVLAHVGPVAIGALAERLVMDRTTLTRNLKPLIDRGLVTVRQGRDRRSREVELSEPGRAALARAMPLWREAQARFVRSLGEGEWGDLLAGLEAAIAATHPDPASDRRSP
jgi:DNA-binding MarR family transcriptional regulator